MYMLTKWQMTALDAATVLVATYTTDASGTLFKEGGHIILPDKIRVVVDTLSEEKKYLKSHIWIYKFEEFTTDSQYFVIIKESGSKRFKVLYPGRIDTEFWQKICARGSARAKLKPLSEIYNLREYGTIFMGFCFFALGTWLLLHGFSQGFLGMISFLIELAGPLIVLTPTLEEWKRVTEIRLALKMLKEDIAHN
jgi:hypothetical protein